MEEIEKRIIELEEVVDKKINEFDKKWFADERVITNFTEDFNNYSVLKNKACGAALIELKKLRLKFRMERKPILSPLPDYGDVMTLVDFIETVEMGGFIDYDGYGHYIHEDQETDIEIYPSDVKKGNLRKEFKSIIWYNR